MEGMTKLMRQCADLIERAIKVAQNATFLYAGDSHTECAAAFTVALLGVDPVIVEGTLGECSKFG